MTDDKKRVVVMMAACLAVLAIGALAAAALANMKRPPAEVPSKEVPLRVKALLAQPEDVQVVITTYGEVAPLDTVRIAPEVGGKVVEVHERLDVGEVIPAGQALFVVDPRSYTAVVADAKANVEQLTSAVERLKTQWANDRERLKTLKRSRDLAKAEFDRIRELFDEDQVGTQSGVDAAEQAYNNTVDQVDQLERALAVYPIQVREMESSLASGHARLELAEYDLERTCVTAPFDARVKEVSIEAGQYVAPGSPVLTLANDAVLELSAPVDSRDARKWLRFNGRRDENDGAWFDGLEPVPCRIRWTEDTGSHYWEGVLHRVERFEKETRMLQLAIRIDATDASSKDAEGLPLVEGMFCAVEIPGRTIEGAYRIPRSAVTFENNVYLVRESRLKTVPVELAYEKDNEAFLTTGLAPGDVVIVTRLVNPLENTLLDAVVENDLETATGPEEAT